MISDGAAMRIYYSTVNMTETVLFYHNRAGNNGGAVYLNHSNLFASQGSVLFHNNTASNGGAVYIGEGSMLYVVLSTGNIEFLGNNATYNGGALYVDLDYINNATVISNSGFYYYNLLENTDCKYNTAIMGNCAYFSTQLLSKCHPIYIAYDLSSNFVVSSSPCTIQPLPDTTVNVNITKNISGDFLKFWSHDLHLAVTIKDNFGNLMGPLNASFWCCDNLHPYNCTIDSSQMNSFVVTSNNTIIECPRSRTLMSDITLYM